MNGTKGTNGTKETNGTTEDRNEIYEKIQDLMKQCSKDERLYYNIFNLLTKDNTLKNYSNNKSGIRFKLNEIEYPELTRILEILINNEKTKETFEDEFIDAPKKRKKI